MIKIGDWYRCPTHSLIEQEFMSKYYSPFKIIDIEESMCTCKGHNSGFTWRWSKNYIKACCKKMTKGQVFEGML